jgi:hypothetical protein
MHVTSRDIGWRWTESHQYNRTAYNRSREPTARDDGPIHKPPYAAKIIYQYIRSHGGSQHYWARYHVLKSKSHDLIQLAYLQLRRTSLRAKSHATAVYQYHGQNTFSKNQNFEFGGFCPFSDPLHPHFRALPSVIAIRHPLPRLIPIPNALGYMKRWSLGVGACWNAEEIPTKVESP